MVHRKVLDYANQHKTALIFAGGIATAIIGKKILETGIVKDATTKAMAGVISAKQDAENAVADMKADAEDIVVENKE